MDRRDFLGLDKKNTIRSNTNTYPYSAPLIESDISHLLKRTLFGIKKTDLEKLKGKTIDEILEIILTTEPSPSPPLNNYNDANYTDVNVPFGQTWVNAPLDSNNTFRRNTSFKSWWIGLMINQSTSIHEKMILFWHNHFATEIADVADPRYTFKHHMLLRSLALGNFKTLVKEMTIDPGMLKYLNGYLNNKNSPDENYARELQELFTLGKGSQSKYTESDVKQAARVLTGYTLNPSTISSSFDPNRHDSGNKQFSEFYNNALIVGKTGINGKDELDELLNLIFSQSETALHICRKLYRFFVYYDIDEKTEKDVIAPLANIFRNSNYEIKPVLKALFSSEHFFDPVNRGCLIKSPIDFCVGLCREFNISFPLPNDIANQYIMHDYIRNQSSIIQQNIGDPPSVSGWLAYHQEPQYHKLWINADTLPKRNQFSDTLISNGYTRNGKKINIDILAFVDKLANPSNPNLLIDEAISLIYSIEISESLKAFLKSILLSGQQNDSYWTSAWNNYKSDITVSANKAIVLSRLQSMFKYLMNLPEYQLS